MKKHPKEDWCVLLHSKSKEIDGLMVKVGRYVESPFAFDNAYSKIFMERTYELAISKSVPVVQVSQYCNPSKTYKHNTFWVFECEIGPAINENGKMSFDGYSGWDKDNHNHNSSYKFIDPALIADGKASCPYVNCIMSKEYYEHNNVLLSIDITKGHRGVLLLQCRTCKGQWHETLTLASIEDKYNTFPVERPKSSELLDIV